MKPALLILLLSSCSFVGAKDSERFVHPRISVTEEYVRIYTYDHARALVMLTDDARYMVLHATVIDSASSNMYLDGVLDMAAHSGARWFESYELNKTPALPE